AMSRDETLDLKSAVVAYNKSVRSTFDLYILSMYAFTKICRVATEDEENRKNKYIPTEADKIFTAKLYENPIIQYLANSKFLSSKADKLHFSNVASADFAKKVYGDFSKEEAYIEYLAQEIPNDGHKDLLLELFRFCRKSEYFNDVLESAYINWIDDKSLVIGTVKKTLKGLPADHNIFEDHLPDPEIVDEFGKELLELTCEEDDELLEYVKPVLENWDHERLAIIDMILIKMALVEFMNFKTIPVKVTLNEYVEISKIYSTPKSKEFVNGILDKLLKKLQSENKIQKEGRGLVD
ncbi:transcription antitermination factor NusB, partial [Saprospiraceae bacterium]|nr:transcription antitermination factor NusB [Saprospiraceae bacterium]